MRGRSLAAAAGAVVVAAVLAGAVVWRQLHPWRFYRGPEYRARFASVAGLEPGDPVRYGGLAVGAVTAVALDTVDPSRLVVTLRVREGTPIRADTRASIPQVTVPVAQILELRPGSRTAARMAPGGELPTEESVTLQESLTRMAAVLERADTLLALVDRLAGGDFPERLGRITARMDTLSAVATSSSRRLVPEVEEAVQRTNVVLARTDRVLSTLDSNRAALASAPGEALAVLRETRALLADVRAGAAGGGGMETLARSLATTSDNLARLTTRLEREPLSVLQRRRLPPKPAGPPLRD